MDADSKRRITEVDAEHDSPIGKGLEDPERCFGASQYPSDRGRYLVKDLRWTRLAAALR
jgi:hypothetical protein